MNVLARSRLSYTRVWAHTRARTTCVRPGTSLAVETQRDSRRIVINRRPSRVMYYYRARYYSPRLQRFISEDPIGFAGGDINLYAYVGNNPLLYVDPFGLDKQNNGCQALVWQLRESGRYAMLIGATMAIGIGAPLGYEANRGIPKVEVNPGGVGRIINTSMIQSFARWSNVLWGAGAIDFTVGALMYGSSQLISENVCK